MTIYGFAALAAKGDLVPFDYTPDPLGEYGVEIEIACCGICHSDIHLIDNDWRISRYPLVPGHEIVGFVKSRGKRVKHLTIGQRVGVGWQRSSCLGCVTCIAGEENLCGRKEATCVGHHGGFARSIISDSRFAFTIPDGLCSESVAPLLCGGITVFSPLRTYNVQPTMSVGVIGIGGLGHLAIQFARAFGCHVTALSSSPEKVDDAKALGAHEFLHSTDHRALRRFSGMFDFILSTVHVNMPWPTYLNLLKPNGTLCIVGAVSEPIAIPASSLIGGQKRICGGSIGSRTVMNEMLLFAERHKIEARVEVMDMANVNLAIRKVRDNQARYRMVLRNSG